MGVTSLAAPTKVAGRRILLLAGLVLVALNLRPAFASVSPVLETVRQDLGLSRAVASLLTTIPVLCMGVFAFGAARFGSRVGLERGLLWAVVLIGVATAGRLAGDAATVLYATTLLIGVGIAVGQALLPAVVKRYFPDRAALVTGVYTVGFSGGAAIAAGATVTLENAFGGSWTAALAFWALLAVPAVAVWWPVVRGSSGSARQSEGAGSTSLPWGSPRAWLVALFFAGRLACSGRS